MQQAVFLVFTHPASSDVEDEFNRWYDDVHLPEVSRVPGFVSARRFQLSPAQRSASVLPRAPYLAIYELEGESIGEILHEFGRRSESGLISQSDLVAGGELAPTAVVYEARSPRSE